MKEAPKYHTRRHFARNQDNSVTEGSGKARAHWGEFEMKYGLRVLTGKLSGERTSETQSHMEDNGYYVWKQPAANRGGYIETPKVHTVTDAEVISD